MVQPFILSPSPTPHVPRMLCHGSRKMGPLPPPLVSTPSEGEKSINKGGWEERERIYWGRRRILSLLLSLLNSLYSWPPHHYNHYHNVRVRSAQDGACPSLYLENTNSIHLHTPTVHLNYVYIKGKTKIYVWSASILVNTIHIYPKVLKFYAALH